MITFKVTREGTCKRRLVVVDEPLGRFSDATAALGAKLGPLPVQLIQRLSFDVRTVTSFFTPLRRRDGGAVAC